MSSRSYGRALAVAATVGAVVALGGCLVSIDESRIDAAKLDAGQGPRDAGSLVFDGGAGGDATVSFCPPDALFCDGFEGKIDDGTWAGGGATAFVSYDTAPPGRSFSGRQALRVTPTAAGSNIMDYRKHAMVLPDAAAKPNLRVTFRALLESSGDNVVGLGLLMGDLQLDVDLRSGQTVERSKSTSNRGITGGTPLPVGSSWHLVQVDIQRVDAKLTVSVDGTPGPVVEPGTGKGLLSKSDLLGTQLTLCLGAFYVAAGQSWKMWVDDVVVTAF